ncbi:MAG: T9SS type A sorting domain-containing protein [Bacteroidales bacterium]|nr:T9SS type A sorting domain-containing protein [Bacteroidales bacterium]
MKKSFIKTLFALLMALSVIPMRAQIVDRDLTNLVIFMRFADDEEITHDFPSIDTMFNGKTPGYLSISNFYDVMTYGHINYHTVYTNNIQNNQIISYQDEMPRGYFMPYSPSNPQGYTGELPFMGICRREAELLARAFDYVNENHLVDDNVVLDGDGDGFIDNVSFVVKGGTGEWASILWPHMEFFPHDSIDHQVVVNGVKPNTFNLEFEGSSTYFTADVFRHEMGHSLCLPDLYHYIHYTSVSPAGSWDMMGYNYAPNHTAAIYKNKILHVCDDPIQITESGDYTLNSVGSSQSQNCYYIKSAIDTTQWFVLEYRRYWDLFDEGIPGYGLIVARWNDAVPLDYDGMFANAFFDNLTVMHQYWIFRPGSSSDIQNGQLSRAHFCQAENRTSFGPTTNPHPYLTDGTPETSFEITDIQENGTQLTFHVHFFADDIEETESEDGITVYPNPATDFIKIQGDYVSYELYDVVGKRLESMSANMEEIRVTDLQSGIYIIRFIMNDGNVVTKKFVKK